MASAIEQLVQRRDAVFGKGTPLFYQTPLHLVKGEGVWLYDACGRRYLDMYNNIPVVGHCNPRVVAALSSQASRHTTHSRYLDDGIIAYAERLLALHADPIQNIVFTCTGTEANEVAMNMARIATGGRGFICTDSSYHGNSSLVGSLTRAPRRAGSDVNAIAFPQRYRPLRHGLNDEQLCEAYLGEVQSAIDDFAQRRVPLAGMLICSIFANEGLPEIPAGFLARAAALVRAAGGLVILDEVQAGFCRTGHWWGYELMGVVPDIVTMGKPMGNGLPFAACAARADLVEQFRKAGRYFNTFAGTPVHAAVGMAVIDEIESRKLRYQVSDVGAYLFQEIRTMTSDIEQVGDVRSRGLFIGIEWVRDRNHHEPDRDGAIAMVNRIKENGALISNAGALGNVLKLRPPLVFDRSHADQFLAILRQSLMAARA